MDIAFERDCFYKHKVSDSVYYCVGFTPRLQPVIMKTCGIESNENSPFILPRDAFGFYERIW